MKVLLLALIGILSVHEAVGQACPGGTPAFQFGFQDLKLHAVENDPYTYCIVAKCGTASAFSFDVRRGYESELPDQVTVFTDTFNVPSGFNPASAALCLEVNTDNNECLDSGDAVLLDIQSAGLPAGVGIAPDCGNAVTNVFDDEVIEFEIELDIINVNGGAATASVCIDVTCVDGPTKRSAPILFFNEAVAGLAERQKKIILIPKGTVDKAKICCSFELDPTFPIPVGGFVDIPVYVKSEDLNVLGEDNAVIRVNEGDCDVCFVDNTPEVMGNQVRVRLSSCVAAATCRTPDETESCDGSADVMLTLNRQTYATLTVDPSAPLGATPDPLTRRLRRDDITRCDTHLIDKGITSTGGDSYILEFEGTGGINGPVTTFYCTVVYPTGSMGPVECNNVGTEPTVSFPFTLPAGKNIFYVIVVPDPPAGITCNPSQERIYHYPPL